MKVLFDPLTILRPGLSCDYTMYARDTPFSTCTETKWLCQLISLGYSWKPLVSSNPLPSSSSHLFLLLPLLPPLPPPSPPTSSSSPSSHLFLLPLLPPPPLPPPTSSSSPSSHLLLPLLPPLPLLSLPFLCSPRLAYCAAMLRAVGHVHNTPSNTLNRPR